MRPRTDACTIARAAGKQNLGAFPEREEGGVGLWSGKKWGGVEKENFTGPALHEGSPRPAVCDLGAVEN